jgi:hypothetical protein
LVKGTVPVKLLTLSATVWFLAMMVDADTRWNAWTGLWSLTGAGILAWWIFERRGPALARREWLQNHKERVRNPLNVTARDCNMLAGACLPVPPTVRTAMFFGKTRSERKAAIAAARKQLGDDPESPARMVLSVDRAAMKQRFEMVQKLLGAQLERHSFVFDQVPLLRLAILESHYGCGEVLKAGLPQLRQDSAIPQAFTDLILRVASATIALAEANADALSEAGLLSDKRHDRS